MPACPRSTPSHASYAPADPTATLLHPRSVMRPSYVGRDLARPNRYISSFTNKGAPALDRLWLVDATRNSRDRWRPVLILSGVSTWHVTQQSTASHSHLSPSPRSDVAGGTFLHSEPRDVTKGSLQLPNTERRAMRGSRPTADLSQLVQYRYCTSWRATERPEPPASLPKPPHTGDRQTHFISNNSARHLAIA